MWQFYATAVINNKIFSVQMILLSTDLIYGIVGGVGGVVAVLGIIVVIVVIVVHMIRKHQEVNCFNYNRYIYIAILV